MANTETTMQPDRGGLPTATRSERGTKMFDRSLNAGVSRPRGFKVRVLALALASAAVGLGAYAPAASAATDDSRIAYEYQITCLDKFGLTPSVRIVQPWVRGTRSTWETIYWQPYLQQWDPVRRVWLNQLKSADYLRFQANNQGPESWRYTNYPQIFVFENLLRGRYYRVHHVVMWGSTGEYGTKASNYQYASGYCWL